MSMVSYNASITSATSALTDKNLIRMFSRCPPVTLTLGLHDCDKLLELRRKLPLDHRAFLDIGSANLAIDDIARRHPVGWGSGGP